MNNIEPQDDKFILQNLLSCFYVDVGGRLDIMWNAYVPFAALYGRLHSFINIHGEPVRFRADPCRMFMFVAVLSGILHDSIRFRVNHDGKMAIDSIALPEDISQCLDCETDLSAVYKHIPMVNETFLQQHFPRHDHVATGDAMVRRILDAHYASRMNELLSIYSTIQTLLFKVGTINYE